MIAQESTLRMTVDLLRERIGGPVADRNVLGAIQDEDLQAILDDERKTLIGAVLSKARDGYLNGADLLTASPVLLPATPSGLYAGMFEAEIPEDYFPFVFRLVDSEGEESTYDMDALQYVRSPFRRFRHFVEARVVTFTFPYVSEAQDTDGATVTATLTTEDDVVESLASEMLADSNDRAVTRAAAMLARRIKEDYRLEGLDA